MNKAPDCYGKYIKDYDSQNPNVLCGLCHFKYGCEHATMKRRELMT